MRNFNLEASIWYLFTSTAFFEAAARECEGIVDWQVSLATSRPGPKFSPNNELVDKFRKRAREFRRGAELARFDKDLLAYYKEPIFPKLLDSPPAYVIDASITCRTGDEVPWTGVWYPCSGLERHSLTFSVKGLRMQPAYRVVKTTEELSTEDYMFPPPETVAVATTWHPVVLVGGEIEANEEQRFKSR